MTLEVTADAKSKIQLPHFDSLKQIVPGVEFVKALEPDTQYINEGKRKVVTQRLFLTSFDTALYLIPAQEVVVDNKKYSSKKMALKVFTMDIDTVHTDSICGIKSEMNPPFTWNDWELALSLSFIALLIAAMLIYVALRLYFNKPIIRRIRNKKRLAPHKAAMQKIDKIKENKTLWMSEDSKEYYTKLTDALRQYINERYGFNAMEMTSYEIIEKLQEVNDKSAIEELRELFHTADLVKFAKYNTQINENDRNLVSAIEYINQTKQEETEQKPQPEEIVVVEKRSKITRITLIAGVCITSLILLAVASYLIYRMYMLTM